MCPFFVFRKVADRLEECFSQLVTGRDPVKDWLRAVPLFHFLREKTAPYKSLEPSANHRSNDWWGTSRIGKSVDKFKENMAYRDENDMYGNI